MQFPHFIGLIHAVSNKQLNEAYVERGGSSVYKKTEDEKKTPSTESLARPGIEEKTPSTESLARPRDEDDFQDSKIPAFYEKDGFLAGEETPVWRTGSYYDDHHRVQYTFERISRPGLPMVKRAMNYWKSLKNTGGFPIRRILLRRSVDDRGNLTSTEHFDDVLRNARTNDYDSPSADSNEVIYPSLLIVMDYDHVFPTDDIKKSWSVEQLILYALAFWSTVDSSMRNIQNPRVSLSIAGIIITTERRSVPYMTESSHLNIFSKGVPSMMKYWRSVSKRPKSDIPIGSYDIIVHMTDILPWRSDDTWAVFFPLDHKLLYRQAPRNERSWSNICDMYTAYSKYGTNCVRSVAPVYLAAGTKEPPCKLTDQIGGFIFYDDLSFYGIQLAIQQMITVLVGSDKSPVRHEFSRMTWTKEILNIVSNALKNTSCMSTPKHHYRPGAPVEPILAGEVMPPEKQCELYGYAPGAWTCWNTSVFFKRSDCLVLSCSDQHFWGASCSEVAATLDGSFCNAKNTKICLNGKCVDKK